MHRLGRITVGFLLLGLAAACGGGQAGTGAEEARPDEEARAEQAPETGARADGPAALPLVIEPVEREFDPTAGIEEIDPVELEALRAAVEADPEDPLARRRLAMKLHGARKLTESIPHFERAVELDANVRSLLDLALAYNSVSRIAESEAVYARLLEMSPDNPLALHNLGAMAAKRGDLDTAISYYQQSLRADPSYLMAQYHLANAYERAGRYKDAYVAFARVWQEMEPTNAKELGLFDDALYRMASLDIKMEEFPRAAEILAELLKANPEHESAHYAYGQVLLRLGRVDEAQREFEIHMRVLSEQHPQSPAAMGE